MKTERFPRRLDRCEGGWWWVGELKKGYDDKLMPLVKKRTQKVYTQRKPQECSFQKNKHSNFTFNSTSRHSVR